MVKLENVCLVGANTQRTKAYIQVLLKNGFGFSHVYIMDKDPDALKSEVGSYTPIGLDTEYFDPKEPLLYTLEKGKISYSFLGTDNINEVDCSQIHEEYLVYSGLGGQILKGHLFEQGKRFIHVHAGILPQYRGSTTIYYSMIREKICGATAIFMSPGIDEGAIITMGTFPLPEQGVDIDYIYEPYTRACVLFKAVKEYVQNGQFGSIEQSGKNANTYYIIHPVLKYIALEQIEKGEKQ